MSSSKTTGGQAFPCLDDAGSGLSLRDGGMTLRDYFAAKAMQGLLASNQAGLAYVTDVAYTYADAMLKVRNK
jgi:hypothetical protein